jgi:hypothetical protein
MFTIISNRNNIDENQSFKCFIVKLHYKNFHRVFTRYWDSIYLREMISKENLKSLPAGLRLMEQADLI